MIGRLLKSKTAWFAVATMGYAIYMFFTGGMERPEFMELMSVGLSALFLRDGIAKMQA